MSDHQRAAYVRALNRGLGCLTLGVGFALPLIGSTAANGVNLLLSLAGYRYGIRLDPY